uniref:Uncharacterized protein n=1 Tax=Oryza sativa subsp. japonica TaxID=39947 RepID=Q6EPN4_ORYSJ|nr:hypothetical protein [Oryza sativa Japonica Group]
MLCQALTPGGRVHRSPTVGGASAADEEEGGSGEEASDKNNEEEERLEELDGEASRRWPSPVVVGSPAGCHPGRPRGLVVTAPSSSSSSSSPPPCSWVVVTEREIEWRGRDRERASGEEETQREGKRR